MTKRTRISTQTDGETATPVVRKETKTTKKRSEWICNSCHVGVTLHVRPSAPPTHVCRKAANKTKQLTLKGESNE